jgi:hypothetical protein
MLKLLSLLLATASATKHPPPQPPRLRPQPSSTGGRRAVAPPQHGVPPDCRLRAFTVVRAPGARPTRRGGVLVSHSSDQTLSFIVHFARRFMGNHERKTWSGVCMRCRMI